MSYDYVYNNERHYHNYLPSATISATTNKKVPTANAVFGVFVNENQSTKTDSAAIRALPKRLVCCPSIDIVTWDCEM